MSEPAAIWIVDRGEDRWENAELTAELRARGHSTDVVEWDSLTFHGSAPYLHVGDRPATLPDLALVRSRVFTRHQSREGDRALLYDKLAILGTLGVRLVNPLQAVITTRNKVRQMVTLSLAGLPVPQTRSVQSIAEIEQCLTDWQDVILKPLHGHSSVDLVRLRAEQTPLRPHSALDLRGEIVSWHLLEHHRTLCAQAFVPNPGRDLRVVVLGDIIVACAYHVAPGTGPVRQLGVPDIWEPAGVTPEVRALVRAGMSALGLDLATFDLVEGPDGLVVIEINPSVSSWRVLQGGPHDLTGGHVTDYHADLLIALRRENTVARREG